DVARLVTGLGLQDRVRVLQDANVYELIVASDVVLTQFSTVGLEAAVLDRSTLVVNFSGATYPVDLHAMGVAEVATTEDELKQKLIDLLFDESTRSTARRRRDAYFARN